MFRYDSITKGLANTASEKFKVVPAPMIQKSSERTSFRRHLRFDLSVENATPPDLTPTTIAPSLPGKEHGNTFFKLNINIVLPF